MIEIKIYSLEFLKRRLGASSYVFGGIPTVQIVILSRERDLIQLSSFVISSGRDSSGAIETYPENIDGVNLRSSIRLE